MEGKKEGRKERGRDFQHRYLAHCQMGCLQEMSPHLRKKLHLALELKGKAMSEVCAEHFGSGGSWGGYADSCSHTAGLGASQPGSPGLKMERAPLRTPGDVWRCLSWSWASVTCDPSGFHSSVCSLWLCFSLRLLGHSEGQ